MATKVDDILLTKKVNTLTLNAKGKYINDDRYFNINIQNGEGSVAITATDATLSSDSSGRNISEVFGDKVTSAPASGYYIKVEAESSASASITTDGWMNRGSLGLPSRGKTVYYPIAQSYVAQNTPTLNSSTGVVTATSSIGEGYTPGDSDTATLQLSTQAGKTVSPTESEQTAVSAGKFTTGTVKVGAISSTYVGSGISRRSSSNLTVSGPTVTAPAGYYASAASADVADGAFNVVVSDHSISTNPVVTGALNGKITTIGTTTKPSGTDGTDYWSVTPSVNLTTTGKSTAKGQTIVNTAGYIYEGELKSDASVIDISPTRNNGTTRYLTKATNSKTDGTVTVTAGTASTSVTGMQTTATDTGYSVSASATGGNASVTASSVTVGAGYNPSSVTASTSASSDTGASASDTKYIQKGVLSASVSSNSAGSASMAATGFTASGSATSYYVTLSTSAGSVKAKASVGTEGYVKSETNETAATSVSVSGNGNKLYIPAGGITPTISNSGLSTYFNSGTSSDKNLTLTPQYTNTAGYIPAHSTAQSGTAAYYKIKTTSASVSGKTVSYGTGWITSGSKDVASGTMNEGTTTVSNTTATRGELVWTDGYFTGDTLGAATFANEATSGQTYVDISGTTSAPVLVAGDYLYINKGYTDNLKISLARLVPDGSDVKGHGEYILSGHSAYDNDGTLVAGSIATMAASDISVSGRTVTLPTGKYTGGTAITKSIGVGTVTSGTASITSLSAAYNTTSGKFDITGSADVSAPSVGTAGYVSSSEGTKNKKTGGATVAATFNKIVGSASISATSRKPSITKRDTPSGVTNAASGAATTTAPSSGVYVAVKSDANTTAITPSVSITTDGYGTSSTHGIVATSAAVGAAASDTTYIPITTTSASVSGKTVSYGSGWITEGSKSVADGSVTPAVNSHTITAPTATGSLSGTVTNIGTTTKPSGTDGTDYWTITPGVTSVKGSSVTNAKATVSAGYIASSPANSGNSTKDITVTTSNGTARYLAKATSSTSNGTATATAGTASTSVTGMVTTTTNTGYSVSASATGGNASVTASSATVGVGYNPSSVTASTSAKSATGDSASQTKYIQKGVLSASISSNTGGSASMSATGFTAASDATSYYVTLATSAGSVKAKAQVGTEGYVKSETNETSATSVAVSGNGTKLYIPAGEYTSSVASKGVDTAAAFTPKTTGTVTDISSTTAPSSGTDGTDYWTITPGGDKTTGKAKAKATATISTAGYIPTGSFTTSSYTTWNITTNVLTGTARYISKATTSTTNGTATATAGTASTSVTGMVTTTTNTGYSVSASATGGDASVTASSATVNVGYNPSAVTASTSAKSATGTSASDTKYIQKGVLSASVSSNSGGSASMAATGFTASSSATSYYVTLSTSAGSVKAKASVGTEGYVKSETNETSATSVAVSGNGTKLYIPAGGITPTISNSGLSTYFNSGTSSDKNLTLTPQYTNTAGYIPAHSTAQSGTAAYYKIKTASPTFSSPTPSGGSTATGTNCTLGSSNTSGISVQTKYSVNAASFTYNAAVEGWVSKASGASAGSTTARSSTNGTNYYLTGVSIPKPSGDTPNQFTVTVPNGSGTINFVFNVDKNGNVTVTES